MFQLYELPDKAMIFQPPRNKTEVLKPINFLGKAKVGRGGEGGGGGETEGEGGREERAGEGGSVHVYWVIIILPL